MGIVLKIFAALILVGAVWVWANGKSVTTAALSTSPQSLAASAGVALVSDQGNFDERGTIILDMTQGQSGTPFLLYTDYSESGKPSVKTKRLVFDNRDACDEAGLPCASDQPGVPVRPDQEVRIVGTVKDEQVIVRDVYTI